MAEWVTTSLAVGRLAGSGFIMAYDTRHGYTRATYCLHPSTTEMISHQVNFREFKWFK